MVMTMMMMMMSCGPNSHEPQVYGTLLSASNSNVFSLFLNVIRDMCVVVMAIEYWTPTCFKALSPLYDDAEILLISFELVTLFALRSVILLHLSLSIICRTASGSVSAKISTIFKVYNSCI